MSIGKRVLILGNGFDLAHKLPTRYSDFLEFAYRVTLIYSYSEKGTGESFKNKHIDTWDGNSFLKDELEKSFAARKKVEPSKAASRAKEYSVNDRLDTFYDYLYTNIWYGYILKLYRDGRIRGVNWIDFESEMSSIIQFADEIHKSLDESYYSYLSRFSHGVTDDKTEEKSSEFYQLCFKYFPARKDDKLLVKNFRKRLYDDLEKLILAFEIYLTDFVEKIPITSKLDVIKRIKPDYVLTFNYTRTYENNYIEAGDNVEVCHIHGMCDGGREPEKNDMVLGMDEYYSLNEIASNPDFAIFRKYIQRIRKKTDTSYADWLRNINSVYSSNGDTWDCPMGEIKKHYPIRVSEVWSFGHSLDKTDKDVLRQFLESDATALHIFACDKADEGELISKLIGIIDHQMVVKKATAAPSRLEFLPMY